MHSKMLICFIQLLRHQNDKHIVFFNLKHVLLSHSRKKYGTNKLIKKIFLHKCGCHYYDKAGFSHIL